MRVPSLVCWSFQGSRRLRFRGKVSGLQDYTAQGFRGVRSKNLRARTFNLWLLEERGSGFWGC